MVLTKRELEIAKYAFYLRFEGEEDIYEKCYVFAPEVGEEHINHLLGLVSEAFDEEYRAAFAQEIREIRIVGCDVLRENDEKTQDKKPEYND
jgi:hypothetical protein